MGHPPNCSPNCILNSDCLSHESCQQHQCINPCINACGENTDCKVIRNKAVCACKSGSKGNPYLKCVIDNHEGEIEKEITCLNDEGQIQKCGQFAECNRDRPGKDVCQCISGYIGQPPLCRPQCLRNADCSKDQACILDKCQNPCQGACGIDAICTVLNHVPRCKCPLEFNDGDPYKQCFESSKSTSNNQTNQDEVISYIPPPDKSCSNQICASNAECRFSVINNQNYCECISGYVGDPIGSGCRPLCILNSECDPNQACINQKCVDPCDLSNTCGINARCSVINHFTICDCEPEYTGNPFELCTKICTSNSNPVCLKKKQF